MAEANRTIGNDEGIQARPLDGPDADAMGTVIALHPEPEEMIKALHKAGAHCILIPKPMPGVTVEEAK